MSTDPEFDHLEEIARRHLHLDTLTPRGRDSLDFHDCYAEGIKAALAEAWRQGFHAGRTTTEEKGTK